MDVIFVPNGLDLSHRLSTFDVDKEITFGKTVTTMDNREHPGPVTTRTIISFSLWPLNEKENAELWSTLRKGIFIARFTNPATRRTDSLQFRVASNFKSAFALRSVDGQRYYKGGIIKLRALNPDT